MTRPVRTIVVLAAIAIAGFVGLALLADRYRKSLPTPSLHDLAPTSALHEVDGFIAVRKAMKAVMDGRPGGMARMRAELGGDLEAAKNAPPRADLTLLLEIASARRNAQETAGIDDGTYDRVLKAYLARKAGKPPADAAVAAALDARKDALQAADLGDYAFFDTLTSR